MEDKMQQPKTEAERATALAQRRETVGLGALPPEYQAAVTLRREMGAVAAKLAETNWGKGLDLQTRKAMAEWGHEFGIDVAQEVDVLGGNIYLNSKFYLRKLAEMIDAGLVEYAIADHIGPDARLARLAERGIAEAVAEQDRRTTQQIVHNCPPADKLDKCVAAVVFRVKLRSMEQEVTGAKWTGDRGKNKWDKPKDPVGMEFPVETAESRAARRCMKKLASHIPEGYGSTFAKMEAAILPLEVSIRHDRDTLREANTDGERGHSFPTTAGFTLGPGSPKAPSVMVEGDPYAPPDEHERRADGLHDPEPKVAIEVGGDVAPTGAVAAVVVPAAALAHDPDDDPNPRVAEAEDAEAALERDEAAERSREEDLELDRRLAEEEAE